ncbi:hypothetical protein EPL64_14490 [Clostridioides difficile]|nr:hypothetical protein [Clostridioides difficile]
MEKFIRLDYDKNFRGKEHRSSATGDGEHFEEGISCYKISKENCYDAIINLCEYWFKIATECEFKDYDINIFEGEYVGEGCSYEDLATCERQLHTLDGSLFNEVYNLYYKHDTYLDKDGDIEELEENYKDEYITTEEFEAKIEEIFIKYL